VWVAPVLAWYHLSFDTEPDIAHTKVHPPNMVMSDFKLCKWPKGLDPLDESVAAALDRVNDERQGWGEFLAALESGGGPVYTAVYTAVELSCPILVACKRLVTVTQPFEPMKPWRKSWLQILLAFKRRHPTCCTPYGTGRRRSAPRTSSRSRTSCRGWSCAPRSACCFTPTCRKPWWGAAG
jgi:hypothetical protein